MEQERETKVVNGVTFTAYPEHGAWYEDPTDGGRVGTLYVPMNADGSMATFDGEPDVGEIEVAYEDA